MIGGYAAIFMLHWVQVPMRPMRPSRAARTAAGAGGRAPAMPRRPGPRGGACWAGRGRAWGLGHDGNRPLSYNYSLARNSYDCRLYNYLRT